MTGKNTERLTTCIKHLAVSGLSSVSARIKSSCNLIGYSFEMPNVSYTQPLVVPRKVDLIIGFHHSAQNQRPHNHQLET